MAIACGSDRFSSLPQFPISPFLRTWLVGFNRVPLGFESDGMQAVAEKLYMVQLKGAQDPEDKAYRQPVRASNVEVSGETLIFSHSDGTLAAFFDISVVSSWAEIDESQLAV
jgi:hypothetical protein